MGEIRKTIGENIKKACALKGIRQVDIAEHMGLRMHLLAALLWPA